MLEVFLNLCWLCYLAKSNFLNLRCLKNRTLLEGDPGPLPTEKMELFVIAVNSWKPYITVLSHGVSTAQKLKFCIKDFFSKCDQMVTFNEEILDRKLHFCAVFILNICSGPNLL